MPSLRITTQKVNEVSDTPRTTNAVQPSDSSASQAPSEQPAFDAQAARRADEMTARAYERSRERIMARFEDKEVARDIVTLAGMTEIYCADHHDDSLRTPYESEAVRAGVYPAHKIPRLCPECAAHTRYGEVRRALCRRRRALAAKPAPTTAMHQLSRRSSARRWPTPDHAQCSADTQSRQFAT